ncbi:MAG: hypothetical protein IJ781_02330 [Atopobiaceae bacterium]|nr:hypothetical protein [Atopobiaceae bacterium]
MKPKRLLSLLLSAALMLSEVPATAFAQEEAVVGVDGETIVFADVSDDLQEALDQTVSESETDEVTTETDEDD